MKAAICSSDGINVDMHFGKTNAFYIVEIDKKQVKHLEVREVKAFSNMQGFNFNSNPSHGFSNERFKQVLEQLKDCKLIFTVYIGEVPREKLREKDIKVTLCNCRIDSIPHWL